LNGYRWLDREAAAAFAAARDVTTEALRKGQGLLQLDEFVRHLTSGEIEIILFENRCAALVSLGKSLEGNLLNILTVSGKLKDCERAIELLEAAAREIGVESIVSVGHRGWSKVMRRQGYRVEERLYMHKRLS
jgi:hypothetical protein